MATKPTKTTKPMMYDHSGLTPKFPTATEFDAAVRVAIDVWNGIGDHDICCAAHAGWVIEGYGLSFLGCPVDPHPPMLGRATSNQEKAKALEAFLGAQPAGPGMKAINWILLLELAGQFLQLVKQLIQQQS